MWFWQSHVQFGQYNSSNCQIRVLTGVYSDKNPVLNPVCNPVRNPVRNPVHNPVCNRVHNPVIGNPYFAQFFDIILAHFSPF